MNDMKFTQKHLMYSISFTFRNGTLFGMIDLPIENLSENSPAAKFISKQLAELNCEIIEYTRCWGYRQTPNRNRCTWTPMVMFRGSNEAMQQLVKQYGQPGQKVPEKETKLFQNKFLWRGFVRPLFPKGTGTPVTVNRSHLSALEKAASPSDKSVHDLIEAIREDGEALVID
jgi:hypothetical protein